MIKVKRDEARFLEMIKETYYTFDDVAIKLVENDFKINNMKWDNTLDVLHKCMNHGWHVQDDLTETQRRKIKEEYEFYIKLEKTTMIENPEDIASINHYRSKASGIFSVATVLGFYL